jgi:hypothetical protein
MASKIGAEGRFRRLSCIRRSSSSARWNDCSKLVSYRARLLKGAPSLAPASIARPREDLVPVPLIGGAPPFRDSIKIDLGLINKLASCLFSPNGASCRPLAYPASAIRHMTSALPH